MLQCAEGDPNARRNEQLMSGHYEGRCQLILNAFGVLGGVHDRRNSFDKNREFISAKTGDRVFRPQAGPQLLAEFNEKLIADEMTETVVDQFEMVEVHE